MKTTSPTLEQAVARLVLGLEAHHIDAALEPIDSRTSRISREQLMTVTAQNSTSEVFLPCARAK